MAWGWLFSSTLHVFQSDPLFSHTWGARDPIGFYLLLFLPLMLVSFLGYVQPLPGTVEVLLVQLVSPDRINRAPDVCYV